MTRSAIYGLTLLLTLAGCAGTSPVPGGEVWTCSNVSETGQQYLQTRSPDELDCGETGEPILLSPATQTE